MLTAASFGHSDLGSHGDRRPCLGRRSLSFCPYRARERGAARAALLNITIPFIDWMPTLSQYVAAEPPSRVRARDGEIEKALVLP